MKSGTEPDDLLELSCSIYFVIKLLCPDVEPLLGFTEPLCKTEKRYSLGDTQLGKKKAPSSSFQSSRSCQTAELGAESVGCFESPLKGLYAVHNLYNYTWQPCLADSCLIDCSTHMLELTRIWNRWRQRHGFHWITFCSLGSGQIGGRMSRQGGTEWEGKVLGV